MKDIPVVELAKNIALPSDAAGHRMSANIPTIHSAETAGRAKRLLEDGAKKFDSINYVYAVSKSGKLKGVVSLKEILSVEPDTPLKNIMATKLVKARLETDQEKVAHLALRNNIKAVPLVDKEGNLHGVLAADQVMEILNQESREDLLKISGIVPVKRVGTDDGGFIHAYASRIPWIIAGLFGGLVTAKVIGGFEHVLSEHIILASFIPLVAYIANAVGTQTQTLYIRDLATKPVFSFKMYVAKQAFVSLLIGFSVWAVMLLLAVFLWRSDSLGMIVGFALFLSILVASFFALAIPKLLVRMGADPANGSGPFATIVQDLLSVVIYLSVASLFI